MAAPFAADFASFSGATVQPSATSAAVNTPESFSFDDAKFNAADTTEKKELFLFQCLSALERDLRKSTLDTIKPSQAGLEKLLLKFLASPIPKPSRPIRKLISRCFIILYTNGDTRTLFDTLSAIQSIVANKKVEDPSIRIAAIYCVGTLSEAHGAKLLSLFPETVTSLLKISKNAKEAEIALRYEALVALTRSLRGAGKGATEAMLKDLTKFAKSGIADKIPLLRTASIELYQAIYEHTPQPPPSKLDEYDAIFMLISKSVELKTFESRRAFALFVATLLNLSQQPIQKKEKPKKGQKAADEEGGATGPERNILTVEELLSVLSTICVKATSRETRIGALEAYVQTLKTFGAKFVEVNYPAIVKNVVDLASHPKLTVAQADAVFMRESCGFILREAVGKMLSESAQVNAMKELGNGWLRKWPAVLGTDVAPSDLALVCVLNELAALLIDLGPAAAGEENVIVEPLLKLLGHPSRSVNLALSWCLRCLATSLPFYMPKLIVKLMAQVQKDLVHLQGEKADFLNRFVGYGNALAALISAAPTRTLYVSYETMARIFGLSAQLLKSASASKDFRAAGAQSTVAWTIIGALMCLGPDFVRVHTSQLLLIWKNVVPKPTTKETPTRTEVEWEYLLTSKEAALAALYSFMIHNPKEIATTDVAKRIAVCLNNTLSFMSSLPTVYTSGLPPPPGAPNPELLFYRMENFLRKRLFLCFKALAPPSTYEMSYSLLLRASLEVFAPDPEKSNERLPVSAPPSPDKGAQASPQQFMVTSLLQGSVVEVASAVRAEDRGIAKILNRDTDVQVLENLIEQHTPGTIESDPHSLYMQSLNLHFPSNQLPSTHSYELTYKRPTPPPISVATIDSAVELFALLLPLQNAAVQESILEQLISLAKYQGTKIPVGRKRAMQLNILSALIGVLKYVMVKKGTLASGKVSVAIRDLVEDFLTDADPIFRTLASEILGRLCRIVSAATFVNPVIQNLVDQVVKNRDPDVRAGSALGLGYILSYVGGMAATSHLKTVVGILHSLATDPHPLVHTWALHSLWLTIESAGLMYGPYVNSTLSVIVKLVMSDSHELTAPAANDQSNNNTEVYPAIGRILYAVVGAIGPELQMSTKVRELCFSLYEDLKNEEDPFVVVEAIRCIQHFILFAPRHVDIFTLIPFLQLQFSGSYNKQGYLTRKAAITCLYQLAQRSPDLVLEAAVNNQLEEQLFALLDTEPDGIARDEIRDILTNLLKHVAPERPSRWLDLCKTILSKTGEPVGGAPAVDIAAVANSVVGAINEDDDDDVFAIDHSDSTAGDRNQGATASGTMQRSISAKLILLLLMPRWRTQVFALACLRNVLNVVQGTGVKEHFDLELARDSAERMGSKPDYLVFRLADLIRMAFSAATANVDDLRLEGLRLLCDVLEKYANAADPDFDDHALLEQYQAQISAALTPAFANDSAPDVLSLACHVSAVYIGSGINQELSTLSRVLRLLTGVMERYKESAEPSGRTEMPHADILLKVSILTAWAELHIASFAHRYLEEVTKPNLSILATLWISILRDYAKVKLEPDVLSAASGDPSARSSMDSYLEATRNVVLPFYRKAWLTIMHALTSLADAQQDLFVKSIRGDPPDEITRAPKTFYVLYGLCIEALSTTGLGAGGTVKLSGIPGLTAGGNVFTAAGQQSQREEANMSKICLESMRRLIKRNVVGDDFIDAALFLETMNLLDKLIQTEDAPVQILVIQIAKQVIVDFANDYLVEDDAGFTRQGSFLGSQDAIYSPTDAEKGVCPRLYKVLKLLYDVFVYQVPALSNNPTAAVTANRDPTPESINLLITALDTLTTLITSSAILERYKTELVPVALYLFLAILDTAKFEEDLVPRVLLFIRVCLGNLDSAAQHGGDNRSTLAHALQSSVSTLLDTFDNEIWTVDTDRVRQEPDDEPDFGTIKNALLAAVLIVTTCPLWSYNEAIQERLVKCLGRGLRHPKETLSMISLQCIRSLVLSAGKQDGAASDIASAYVRLLIPHVIIWLLGVSEELCGDSGRISTGEEAVEESLKLLLLLYGTTPDDRKKVAVLSIIVPVFISFIAQLPDGDMSSFRTPPARNLHIFACQILLQVASQQPQHFKIVIAGLKDEQKEKLQAGLKNIVAVQQGRGAEGKGPSSLKTEQQAEVAAPKIELKTFAAF